MSVIGLDHLYAETVHWDASVAFWEGVGFSFAEQWGSEGHRAGRLVAGEATVVLAEVPADPECVVFFAADPARPDLTPTHWGTRLARHTDPDGRVHALEAPQ